MVLFFVDLLMGIIKSKKPSPTPCPPCPTVTYITTTTTGTLVPTGGTAIPPGSTVVPAGTVTVINGFTTTPATNIGGVNLVNGQFIVPICGRYFVSGSVCFTATAAGNVTLYIYKVDAITGVITLLAANTVPAAAGVPSCVNAATAADLNPNDRVFFALTQTTGAPLTTTTTDSRFVITRIC